MQNGRVAEWHESKELHWKLTKEQSDTVSINYMNKDHVSDT